MRRNFVIIFALVLLALTVTACGFNLAGDLTPPPGWHPTAVPPTPDTANLYPAIPPDPVIGEQIYQQECEQCHGPRAMGDGPKAAELGITPAALASAEEVREDPPIKRFLVLAHGKEEDGMPSFAGKLTERQRWDVLAYVYTLSVSPQKLEKGKSLYNQRCVACHGKDGKGKNLIDQKRMANLSDDDIAEAITGKQHPADVYEGLSEEDRLALASYVRLLSFSRQEARAEGAPTATPAVPTPTPSAENATAGTPAANATAVSQSTITITGTVTNGTAGGKVPADLEVELQGYDNPSDNPKLVVDLKTKLDADGKFRFDNVPNAQNRLFFVSATYKGVLYGSHSAVLQHDTRSIDLPVVIYEPTTDKSSLSVERLHILFDSVSDHAVRVIEMYVITNNGDKTVVADKEGEPVLTFDLPEGATGLMFENGALGGRYVKTEHGFGDTAPIRAQSQMQEVFAFALPMQSKSLEIAQPLSLPVDSAVLMLPAGSLKASGALLQDSGVQQDAQGNSYHIYLTPALQKGSTLEFKVVRTGGGLSLPSGSRRNLAFGLVAVGLALIITAVVLTRRNRLAAAEEAPSAGYEDPEILMDAILALDDLYKQGKLDEEAYQKRRSELKARLKDLLASGEEQEE